MKVGNLIIEGTTGTNEDIIINGNTSVTDATGALIDCYANLTLKNVALINNTNTSGTAGGIQIRDKNVSVNLENIIIGKCTAKASSAMYLQKTWSGTVNLNRVIIQNNKATDSGGTIRTNGGGNGKLTIKNSIIRNNTTELYGGAVYWNANGVNAILEIIDSQMLSNTATERGGGLFLEGSKMIISASKGTPSQPVLTGNIPEEMIGTYIQGNEASYGGGGIFISGYGGGANVGMTSSDSFNLTLEENVFIQENSAELGGGVGLDLDQADPEDGYTYNVNINGAKLYNNTATTYGGAICCKLNYNKYNVNVKMTSGTAINNTADSGGAIFVSGGDFELSGTAEISSCNATNGGGLNVSGGNVTINGGNINDCESTNGGALSVSGGNIIINNGTISNCKSTNGGGLSVSGGNATINAGTITNCLAKNGGGLYISNGDLTMNGGTISNNQATRYGGGIYASSDSQNLKLSITSGSIVGNIASVNGGGIGINIADGYSATVTVGIQECLGIDQTHIHPIIQDNTANEYGGGFWLYGKNMTMNMYCGYVSENLAIKEPGSSNIYQTGGNATVYSGEVGEGVIVIGGEYIYVPKDTDNEVTIIYNSNIPNNEETKEALVTIGIEIYLPKTLYTRDGYILAGWSHVKNPGLDDIIYEAGGPYMVTDKSVTVYAIWLKEGTGTVENPIINAGKNFDRITGGSNIIITSNSPITAEMAVNNVSPKYYTNRTISFNKNLEIGTTITMIDFSDLSNRKYYSYKVENSNIQNIPLVNFTKNGGNDNFVEPVGENEINEIYIFILEQPKDSELTGTNQMSLIRYSTDSEIAPIEQIVSYTNTNKRTFRITAKMNENQTIESDFSIGYESTFSGGNDSYYTGKNVALILKQTEDFKFTEETQIFDGTNYYNINSNGEFIIPIGDIQENKEKNLKLISKKISENEIEYNINVELWVAENSNYPGMGEKITEIKNIKFNPIELSAINIDLSKFVYNQEEFYGELKLNYEILNLENNKVKLELQKKVSANSYITQIDKLKSVNEIIQNENGIFEIELTPNGFINIEFTDGFKENGTYRILIKSNDDMKNNEVFCNFIIVE